MSVKRLAGKTAVVTGAGKGIGKGVATRLASEGAQVVIADIDIEAAEQTKAEIMANEGAAVARRLDLSDVSDIFRVIDSIDEEFGGIFILVNVAGVLKSTPFLEVTPEEWDFVIDVNQRGTAFAMQAVAKRMISRIPEEVVKTGRSERCYGKIVNFSSISGRRGRAYQLQYAASKAAIISLTQSAAMALAPYGINVNAVAPSVVRTPMWEQNVREKAKISGLDPETELNTFVARIPLMRAGTPEEMAATVAFLCSAEADYITGQTLNVDGGFEMD